MQWENEFVTAMRLEFGRRQSVNPKYSLRKYAKDLGLSASGMSNLLRSRFDLSLARAAILLPRLKLPKTQDEKLRLIMGIQVERKAVDISPPHSFVLTDWVYLAVMHFFDLDVADKTAPAIAQRLALDLPIVEQAIERLLTEGFLQKAADGSIYKPEIHWCSGDGGALEKEIIRAHHRENLKVATRAIDQVPSEHRDLSSITFCGNPDQMDQIRTEVRNLHRKVSAMMENSSPKTDVYRLSVALFPLTCKGSLQ